MNALADEEAAEPEVAGAPGGFDERLDGAVVDEEQRSLVAVPSSVYERGGGGSVGEPAVVAELRIAGHAAVAVGFMQGDPELLEVSFVHEWQLGSGLLDPGVPACGRGGAFVYVLVGQRVQQRTVDAGRGRSGHMHTLGVAGATLVQLKLVLTLKAEPRQHVLLAPRL